MIELTYIRVDQLEPNPWNANEMDDEMLRKEVESIREFGFVDPITVRPLGKRFQIIDGEHRWKGAQVVGLESIPCIILDVTDEVAEQLSIVLNDLRGKANPERLAAIVRDLSTKRTLVDLERILPYKRAQLMEMLADRKASVDWSALETPPKEERETERWVERVYRLPIAAAEVIDEAIAKVRDDGVEHDWRALEMICADYMAGV